MLIRSLAAPAAKVLAALGCLTAQADAALAAPTPIAVGDPRISCASLKPYENAWLWTITTPDGKAHAQGIWSDRLDLTVEDGRTLFRHVGGISYVAGKSHVAVNLFDPTTCAPVRFLRDGVDHVVVKRTFSGGHVVTEKTAPGAQPETTSFDISPPAFDFFGGQDALLLTALHLKVGDIGVFQAVSEPQQPDGLKLAPFRVVREETVSAGVRGRIRTLVTVQDLPGEYTATYWLSPDPPYYIRLEMTFPDGRYRFSFDMI